MPPQPTLSAVEGRLWVTRAIPTIHYLVVPLDLSVLYILPMSKDFQYLMLKLKLQSFGHLMQRADSLEKTLMLGKIEGRRRRG